MPTNTDTDYLFVYGTLLTDSKHEMSQFLASHAQLIGKGFFYGKLYIVTWFPGAVLSNSKNEKVHGMVFKVESPETVFKVLDDYEGIGDYYKEPHLFKKAFTNVYLKNGTTIKASVYLYNLPTKGLKQIIFGDYLKYCADN